jgi:DNA-binding CsgD family transcriptional regulator
MQEKLTPKEQEILHLLLEGISLKEIAHKLGVSYKTVDYHRGNLYRKFGIQSMQELLVMHSSANNSRKRKTSPSSDKYVHGVFYNWITFGDSSSSSHFSVGSEVQDGQTFEMYTLSGSQGKENGSYAGVFGFPDFDTRTAMKAMALLSFKVLGDGNEYLAMLPTSDTVQGDHYFKKFSTTNGEITTITVDISDELVQWGWSGIPLEFIQDNIMYLQFQPACAGAFDLKIWDIRLHS